MAKQRQLPVQRRLGYPAAEKVQRGCRYAAENTPEDVYIVCTAQLHNLSERKTAALLQVFKVNTLAACWMLRDIAQRRPEQCFAAYRRRGSTKFFTDGIQSAINKIYRERIRSRYTLNSYIFEGLCTSLASSTSSYLQKITQARQKGWLQQYDESAAFIVPTGKHCGTPLGKLGRKTIFGYAFITPKREQCAEALNHINVLLQAHTRDTVALVQGRGSPDPLAPSPPAPLPRAGAGAGGEGWGKPDTDFGEAVLDTSLEYTMSFGPRRKRLGTMRPETLRRLKLLVERDLERADDLDCLRQAAQTYLRFTPPGFPSIRSDGLSPDRQRFLEHEHQLALDAFAALPEGDTEPPRLADDERYLFRLLQQRAYAATATPHYVPLRWNRADGCVRQRECALVYDPAQRRYLFLAYVLDRDSRQKRTLNVQGDLYDVNNPTTILTRGQRPSTAMLFELEFALHQQQILDQARRDSGRWKEKPETTGGSVRSATLHAHYDAARCSWWFEVQLHIGIKPTHIIQPEHAVGVHVDPVRGMFVTVLDRAGKEQAHIHLDERTIATWLHNKDPAYQARLTAQQRTAKERQHRLADALVAICTHYRAVLGVENIAYRRTPLNPAHRGASNDASRSVVNLLTYKLARVHLPNRVDVRGVAPTRDCSACGARHAMPCIQDGQFTCPSCRYSADRHVNTAREVARQVLWIVARKTPPQRRNVRTAVPPS